MGQGKRNRMSGVRNAVRNDAAQQMAEQLVTPEVISYFEQVLKCRAWIWPDGGMRFEISQADKTVTLAERFTPMTQRNRMPLDLQLAANKLAMQKLGYTCIGF